jgi:hypothetical protein
MLLNLKACLRRFKNDDDGAFSLLWGVSALSVILLAGSAYDLGQLTKAKKVAQFAADSMALSASIAVDTGNADRYVEGQNYAYTELGGPSQDFTGSMVGKVVYDIVDDRDPANQDLQDGQKSKLIARATITGSYRPAFMAVAGFGEISFRAVSDVSYTAKQGAPASVFFVVDNSGSMGDNDTSGAKKITSLENSMTTFMATLNALDSAGSSIFRTAMYPFSADVSNSYSSINNNGVIPAHVVTPKWGTIPNTDITRMYDRYGTDSSGALEDAKLAFEGESSIHLSVNQEDDPLKFAVFMTDGANNPSCENTQYGRVDGPFYYRFNGSKLETSEFAIGGWNYFSGSRTTNSYTHCSMDYWFDQRSLATCGAMKDDGIKIFAIAYDIDAAQKARAENFMQQCSSGEEYFKSASDSVALDLAFTQISDSIICEVIRIKR